MPDATPSHHQVRTGADTARATEPANRSAQADRAELLRDLNQELNQHQDYLRDLAERYNWWQSPEVALQFPARLVVQVMNLGTFADISQLWRTFGDDCLRRVLESAEAGQLTPRSWHYWHYRLKNVSPGGVPPMPKRQIA